VSKRNQLNKTGDLEEQTVRGFFPQNRTVPMENLSRNKFNAMQKHRRNEE